MTITTSGAKCDICGDFILPGLSDSVNPFTCKGIKNILHCHDNCKAKAIKALKINDWKSLPSGPLRSMFEEQAEQKEAT